MKTLLRNIIQSPSLYARFLNTLSLLEYIGARKILKSQPQQYLNEKMLGHAAEEIRHAQVLKRAAVKIAPRLCDTYSEESLLCGKQACHYFQTIDRAAETELNEHDALRAYLYTTLLIEQRATAFYADFESVLQEVGKSVFRGILVEEKKHLEEIVHSLSTIPCYQENIITLQAIEQREFTIFLSAVAALVSPHPAPGVREGLGAPTFL